MIKQPEKITSAERELGISQYPKLQEAIETGAWEYSQSKLKADFDAFKFTTWVQVHPFLTAIVFLFCCLLGGIPAIIFVGLLLLQKSGRQRYEVALQKLKHGNFFKG